MPRVSTFDKVAFAAGVVGTTVFALGFALSFLLPEPKVEKAVEPAPSVH
jgi:hypothetical protein